jgi:hypothetical protein
MALELFKLEDRMIFQTVANGFLDKLLMKSRFQMMGRVKERPKEAELDCYQWRG